jgi:hypothetical protein
VEQPEKIADHEVNIVSGFLHGQPLVGLYFDQQSGLLVRLLRYAESPLGRNPTRIDYADYRDQGGVKIPYRGQLPALASARNREQATQLFRAFYGATGNAIHVPALQETGGETALHKMPTRCCG